MSNPYVTIANCISYYNNEIIIARRLLICNKNRILMGFVSKALMKRWHNHRLSRIFSVRRGWADADNQAWNQG